MNIPIQTATTVTIYLLGGLSVLKICIFLIKFIRLMLRQILPCQELSRKYGGKNDVWAVVTGATDGIGKGFCQNLAEMGWNVCLISRNGQKIEKVIQQLKRINNNNLYQGIVADFKDCQKDADFFNKIKQSLSLFDIGILINNVGVGGVQKFHQFSSQEHIDLININCVPQTIISHIVIQKMQKRKQRSAIINMSSYAALDPLPFISLYAGTKGFNDAFSRALAEEYSDNIDILSATVMQVKSGSVSKEKSFRVPTSKECSLGCLKDLGYSKRTYGHITHAFLHSLISVMPYFLIHKIALKQAKRVYEQYKGNSKKKQ